MVKLLNIDCMEYMRSVPDKYFELAVVDPPYGLGDKTLTSGGTWASKYNTGDAAWDIAPTKEYFDELFRVSQNQIVWGGNYFDFLPGTRCFIIWDKVAHMDTLADCEFAWTSFEKNAKIFKHVRNTAEQRIHITQKPLSLYKFVFKNYAKPGDKILDTHLGSASSAIVAEKMGFDFVGCEINKEIFEKAVKRYNEHTDLGLFQTPPQSGEGSVGQKNLLF